MLLDAQEQTDQTSGMATEWPAGIMEAYRTSDPTVAENLSLDPITGLGSNPYEKHQGAVGAAISRRGFSEPFSGTPRYEKYAPKQAVRPVQLNRPLGTRKADMIAKGLGLNKRKALTKGQYELFITGKGVGGQIEPAKLVDESVRILTNTTGRPLYSDIDGVTTPTVLASYGLMVNPEGLLESPANSSAPTRQVNSVLEPGGYMDQWCKNNHAAKSLKMLYKSAFTAEAVFGAEAQAQSGYAQLVPNQKGTTSTTVGMSMAPSIWIVNFCLIYMLNPKLAAAMPAYWTPIPTEVVDAINAAEPIDGSPGGQVPYSQYASLLSP